MLQNTQAMRALQDGCRRLGLPTRTATALVQFLSVKRTHDQLVAAESRQLLMSPGYSLDRLWHYMLLNTAVSSLVHDLLGGVVEHRGIDSTDLPDDTKLLQRLYALNILRLEGHEPDVALWTEPGTALHTLHLTASPVAALQHLPGGGRLYVTPTLTQQQQGQLVRALQLLYAEGEGTCSSNVQQPQQRHQPKTIHLPASAALAAALARAAQPGAKRAQLEQPVPAAASEPAAAAAGSFQLPLKRPAPDKERQEKIAKILAERQRLRRLERHLVHDGPVINLIVKEQTGEETHFKVRSTTPLWRVMEAMEQRKGFEPDVCSFLFDGQRVGTQITQITPADLAMEDGDCIDMMVMQTGC